MGNREDAGRGMGGRCRARDGEGCRARDGGSDGRGRGRCGGSVAARRRALSPGRLFARSSRRRPTPPPTSGEGWRGGGVRGTQARLQTGRQFNLPRGLLGEVGELREPGGGARSALASVHSPLPGVCARRTGRRTWNPHADGMSLWARDPPPVHRVRSGTRLPRWPGWIGSGQNANQTGLSRYKRHQPKFSCPLLAESWNRTPAKAFLT